MIDLVKINPLLEEVEKDSFRITAQQSLTRLAEKVSGIDQTTASRNFQTGTKVTEGLYIKALNEIIQSNQLDIDANELQSWLHSSTQVANQHEKVAKIDRHILPILAKNNALVANSLRLKKPKPLDENTRAFQVCRLSVSIDNGRVISNGTGFFVTDSLVLTCRHVLGKKPLEGLSIQVHVPHYHGSSPILNDVTVWSEIRFMTSKSLGKPFLLAESSPFSDAQEKGAWEGNPDEKHLDYCVLEIDKSTEEWSIGITADKKTIPHVNANFVLTVLPNQLPMLKMPATFYFADELEDTTVLVHTLTEELKIETISGGSVQETSSIFHRIRYGDGSGIIHGDSGSPITNQEGELIALHNAFTGKNSQAIPIGSIFEDIQDQNSDLYNLIIS